MVLSLGPSPGQGRVSAAPPAGLVLPALEVRPMVHTQDPTQDHTPDRVIHYAPGSVLGPGDRPLCGNESSTAVYSEDPRQVAGCAEGQQPAGGPSRPSRIGPRWPGLYRQRLRQRLRLTLNYLSAHTCPPRRSARRSALLAAHAPLNPAICFTLLAARRVERRRDSLSWPIPRAWARERCPMPWGWRDRDTRHCVQCLVSLCPCVVRSKLATKMGLSVRR